MSERKRKRRGPFDIFGFDEDNFLLGGELEPSKGEGGCGYSMSVTYDEKGKPVVKVETYGDVDVTKLRDIQQRYPGAKIEGLEKQPLIRVVNEEETEKKPEKKTEEKRGKEEKKEKKKPLIRIIE